MPISTEPVVERPGQRQTINAASAVNAKGGFCYCTYEGGLTAELFVHLLRQLVRHRVRPVRKRYLNDGLAFASKRYTAAGRAA